MVDIRRRAEELAPDTVEKRRYLHRHPELSWEEYDTCAFIEEELKKLGLTPRRFDDCHTGLYAEIHGGKAGTEAKTILLRADIDALPIQERTGAVYASEIPGKMHACGHDAHVAMLLSAAQILCEIKDELQGHVKLLFQAGEETSCGAKFFLDAGVLEGVDAVYGSHIVTWLEAPFISVDPGARMAGCDQFSIEVKGVSSHGGMPYRGRDAIVAAGAVVSALQSVVSRRTDALDALVITIGTIQGGSAYNVVCDEVTMTGTVRTYDAAVRAGVPALMREAAENAAKAYGCTAELTYENRTPPVIHWDDHMNQLAKNAVLKLYGPEALHTRRAVGGGDDFGYFLQQRPGIYAFIGAANAALGCDYDHHHPCFDVDESVFSRGTAMYAQMAVDFLNE